MEGDNPSSGTIAQILVKLGEMGTQLAVVIEQLKPISDHETRLRVVERSLARIMGAAAAVGVLSGAGGSLITYLLTHK